MSKIIPIIDIFAGPGGLGEGFSALGRLEGHPPYKIGLSVEKEESAHQTLLLRSFFRQFQQNEVPEDYYSFLRGDILIQDLFDRHKEQYESAKNEALKLELGTTREVDEFLDERISRVIAGHDKWVLIGGPPCQAYSLIGRSRNSGKEGYSFEDDHRCILYLEYLRILAKHQPPVFVMENVKGLLSAKAHGKSMFAAMISDLQNPFTIFPQYSASHSYGYKIYSLVKHPQKRSGDGASFNPKDYVVKSEVFGIPQARHRVILLGIREDYASFLPDILTPADRTVTSDEVLSDLPALRSGFSCKPDSHELWTHKIASIVDEPWLNSVAEIHGVELHEFIKHVLENTRQYEHDRGHEKLIPSKSNMKEELSQWYTDRRMSGICNHSTRGHIFEDIQRYLFASCFAQIKNASPTLYEYPAELLPKHKNVKSGKFVDRFKVQQSGRPSTTVTSHISKDGHYYIHPDPYQARSFTVREAARLQTFPDNYFFCGNRTQQYGQVGNAVPPLLAYKIAKIVHDYLRRI